MKLILLCLVCIEAKLTIFVSDDPVQQIGSRFYKKILLTNKYQDPKELSYDSASRNLFFSHMDDDLQNSGRAYVNVITKNTKKIDGISRNKATAVDADTSDVFFGSEDGLYEYNAVSNSATLIGLYNVNILKLVIRNNEMYLIDANNHMIYKVKNHSKTVKVGEWKTVMEFEVDYKRNIHFVNMCGLFCVPEGSDVAVKNTALPLVYHFISDEQKTFGVTLDGIYEIDCNNGTAVKVANIDFYLRSITFGDYGDIYYSTDDSIYRLKPINSYVLYNIKKN
ncbi:uncharacterized protein [Choristoneura fumiferana]|uniref:uncharacterized protein n=1 Tax=Choristoneura fumiferana TaxID=7141 RepID=UPI003D15BC02